MNDAQAAVSLHNVSKSWGERHVLRDVSFTFRSGETWIISGRSGNGKTTLLHLIAGYITPDSGSITSPSNLGYLLQDDVLMSGLTAIQNVEVSAATLPQHERAQKATDALESAGIGHRANVPVEFLSGGERQRVQIASLLLKDADVILFDEPTSSLDSTTRSEIAELINTVLSGKLHILVSHDKSFQQEFPSAHTLHLVEGRLHRD